MVGGDDLRTCAVPDCGKAQLAEVRAVVLLHGRLDLADDGVVVCELRAATAMLVRWKSLDGRAAARVGIDRESQRHVNLARAVGPPSLVPLLVLAAEQIQHR